MNQSRAKGDKPVDPNPSHFKENAQLPVESVTWQQAYDYCQAVGMRLPTEAEWEYAARATSTDSRYGDIESIAWYCDNSAKGRIDNCALWKNAQVVFLSRLEALGGRTHPVKKKSANNWKLHDMLGNVWEWTGDWYDQNYYKQASLDKPWKDPQGPTSSTSDSLRVIRGGSWHNGAWVVRTSRRQGYPADAVNNAVGFRCAGEVIPTNIK